MSTAPMAAAPEAGVVDLLKRLRSHVCCESRSDLRRILPVYQRLLSPREDADISVQHELLRIRGQLLLCGEDADVADVVDRMDRVVECCMRIQEQENQSTETAVPMDGVMRLLVALAGGEDGETFVLEDPMQVTNGKSDMFFAAAKKRVGDRIRMNDVGMVQRSRALFHKAPVPLQEKALFSQDLFGAFGNGISSQHSSLWCPDSNTSENKELLTMEPFKKTNQFFGLPGIPAAKTELDSSFTLPDTPKRQRHGQSLISDTNINILKTLKPGKQTRKRLSPSKEIFFYDGTQEVHCGERVQQAEWGEVSSLTENSSWGSESSIDISEPWIAQTYAWEDMGDRTGLHESYAKPLVRRGKRSLRDLVIPDAFSCRNFVEETPLEIHEEDFIEDALRALSGVESTIFRRDLESATFQLPEMRRVKLPNTTVSATMSVLEIFQKAGSTVMRLELLAVYYSQNPARGGKTLQAMGDALQLYLSSHRSYIENIAQECLKSGEAGQEDEIISVTKLVCKTRKVCRVLEIVGEVYSCDGHAFWPLLQEDKFPRGIALLNRLYHHVSSLRAEDSSGRILDLVTWFLVKSCSPLLAVLSDLISTGRVNESTDPFDEFHLTVWSRNLHTKVGAGGGDGLFSEKLSAEGAEMLPKFLGKISPLIIHISYVQALLRSVNAIASTHPLINMQSLVMFTRGHNATRHAEKWQSTIAEAMASTGNNHLLDEVETYESPLEESCATDEKSPRRYFIHEDAEAKQNSQWQQRSMLDLQVLEKRQHQLDLARHEEADDRKRLAEMEEAQREQDAYGRKFIFKRYSLLMNDAEKRHDYMKWRRDRAIRISNTKKQLRSLHANEAIAWTSEMEKRSSMRVIRATEQEVVNVLIDENGDREPKTSDIEITGKSGVPMTPGATSEWKSSVKVNKEAGNRTSTSTEDGWRPSVKVNKEARSRTSASIEECAWKTSVKVNKDAGSRSSGILNGSASTEMVSQKTGIRILNEPGGSGADMYGTLYGGSEKLFKECVHSEGTVVICATDDVEMDDSSNAVGAPMDEIIPCEPLLEASEIEMQNAIHDGQEIATRVDRVEELPTESNGDEGTSVKPMRVSLPPVHPFFLATVSQADYEVLASALTETTSAVEFTSFTSIVDCCVEGPVRLIAEKLEQVALDWFRNSLRVLEHLRWLRRLMLMAEGLCMDIFARDFLHGLNSVTRVNWGLEGQLSSALSLAMIEGSVKLDSIAQRFHYETTAVLSQVLDSLTMTPAVPSVLGEFALVYDVKWPLGLVITSKLLDQYKQMHRFLLHIRLTSLEMRGVWGMLRMIRRQGQLPSELERLCGSVVYKMQAFVRAFNEAFATKVLMAAWTDLEHASQKATTLVELRHCHEEYVSVAVRCCFLDRPSEAIHLALLDTLATTWSLTGFVRAQVTSRALDETRMRTLCDEFNTALRALVGSLQSVTRDAERNTREFSECLLLRLNFNHFYDDRVTTRERVPGRDGDATVEF